jgi:putative peptide zinc metalloprotease protein
VQVEVPGRLKRLAVREGQSVRKGAVLAEFESHPLDAQEQKARVSLERYTALARDFEALLAAANEPKERQQLQEKKRDAEIEARTAQEKLRAIDLARKQLVLTAPRDGNVIGLPKIDDIGKTWARENLEAEFCRVGDLSKLRALVPVSRAEYQLIGRELKQKREQGQQLTVTIRVRGERRLRGHVAVLPAAAAGEIPGGLSKAGGGPLATKPGSPPGVIEPAAEVYLIGIELDTPGRHVLPGTLGKVEIPHGGQ